MTTIIGIFDNPLAVEQAVSQLNEKGLTQEVFDPNLEFAALDSGGSKAALAIDGSGALQLDVDYAAYEYGRGYLHSSLSGLKVPDEAIQYYETLFDRGEIFVVIETEERFKEEVMNLMRTTGASLIGRHS